MWGISEGAEVNAMRWIVLSTKPPTCSTSDTLIEVNVKAIRPGAQSVLMSTRGQVKKGTWCTNAASPTEFGSMFGIAAFKDKVYGFSRKGDPLDSEPLEIPRPPRSSRLLSCRLDHRAERVGSLESPTSQLDEPSGGASHPRTADAPATTAGQGAPLTHAFPQDWRDIAAIALVVAAIFLGYRRKQDDPPGGDPCGEDWLSRAGERLMAEDWMVLAYLGVLFGAVGAGSGPRRPMALGVTGVILGAYVFLQKTAHESLIRSPGRELIRRLALVFGVLGSFAELHYVLPTATERAVDATIYGFDHAVFGMEPAEAWDRFVRPATTEWFSLFYFNYYTVILVFLVPFVIFGRPGRLLQEFAFGFLFIFCVGQTVYMLVPAYGPYAYLAGHFQHPLDGPFWWKLVTRAVDSGEGAARKDIFPSLHTAAPTFLTLFSLRHRRLPVFRFTWPVMGMIASQIVIATMFLRWHYLVDVLAGLGLAGLGVWSGRKVADRAAVNDRVRAARAP